MDALLVRPQLLARYAVLAHLKTVVRGEKDVRVVQHPGAVELVHHPFHQIIQRLQGFGPIFLTGVYLCDFGRAEFGQRLYPGGFVGDVGLVEGARAWSFEAIVGVQVAGGPL